MTTGRSKIPDLKEMSGMMRKFFGDLKKVCSDILKDYQEKRQSHTPTHKAPKKNEDKAAKAPKAAKATKTSSGAHKPKTTGTEKKTSTRKKEV